MHATSPTGADLVKNISLFSQNFLVSLPDSPQMLINLSTNFSWFCWL
ncbi:hypothetical protein H6G36_12055 [Anabaena minutissima FACHB-250]|nr:hypothetical protein [Anabaena minutissima FACHB-250]